MMSGDRLFDDNDAVPAPRTGILLDPSKGEFKQDSYVVNACEGMLELNKVFKMIDDNMTSMQEWSYGSKFQLKREIK